MSDERAGWRTQTARVITHCISKGNGTQHTPPLAFYDGEWPGGLRLRASSEHSILLGLYEQS